MKVEPVEEQLNGHKSNWLRHVTRMNNKRMPKIMQIIDEMDEDGLEDI
jgi:hypothetical protein